ncbi:MAG: NnrU family protein [Acetobacteraceae bacterium]|nr:NnrU family protein [Acetobacteraceae bacterium]
MQSTGTLALAALVWVGTHVGIAGTRVRAALAGSLGERGFRLAYSLLSVAAIVFLVNAYKAAPAEPLWHAPDWLRWALAAPMLPAFVLVVASVTAPNPTAAGGERALGAEPRGVQRITRHPMLWSFALWAAVHVLGNGDAASLLFFGAFGLTALAGMPSIDAKIAARDPEAWGRYAARTSILPFGAIAAGRNRFSPGEIGWLPPALGVALWLGLLAFHQTVFGVPPVPAAG